MHRNQCYFMCNGFKTQEQQRNKNNVSAWLNIK